MVKYSKYVTCPNDSHNMQKVKPNEYRCPKCGCELYASKEYIDNLISIKAKENIKTLQKNAV